LALAGIYGQRNPPGERTLVVSELARVGLRSSPMPTIYLKYFICLTNCIL
jgi:hypothetical protein